MTDREGTQIPLSRPRIAAFPPQAQTSRCPRALLHEAVADQVVVEQLTAACPVRVARFDPRPVL